MRKWKSFTPKNEQVWMVQIVQQAQKFEHAILLTDNDMPQEGQYKKLSKLNFLAGFGALEVVEHSITNLKAGDCTNDWYLGFLSYDLKNDLYPTNFKKKKSVVQFPNLHLFRPKWIIKKEKNQWRIGFSPTQETEKSALDFIADIEKNKLPPKKNQIVANIQPSFDKKSYIETFQQVQEKIEKNYISELNLCIEFCANDVDLNPASTFLKLMQLSPTPFAALVKYQNKYAFCASPERFLTKRGNELFSMPMKGTAPRGKTPQQDEIERSRLKKSEKEQQENRMTTELVRNELSQISHKGTVQVDELCGIYPFPNVFQMVSTLSSKLKREMDWTDALKNTFPMASMTGAPKFNAMQLIDKYETSARGLFSGAIGYLSPEKDFDFNVVIRTLFYNDESKDISLWAGSAITKQANASDEYNECLLKAEVIIKGLLNSEKQSD